LVVLTSKFNYLYRSNNSDKYIDERRRIEEMQMQLKMKELELDLGREK
jgi:hypothetical protein